LDEVSQKNAATSGTQSASTSESGEHSSFGRLLSAVGNSIFYGALGVSAFIGYYHYAYDINQLESMVKESQNAENQFPGSSLWAGVLGWYVDKRKYIESEMKKYADPPSDRLLPDLPPHARHIKTLVLDLDDVLIHSDWTRARGWRTFKRPGVEDFLKDMAQYYELVVYTSQLPTYADPILDRLDPQRLLQYRLYRDSTRYVNGKHVRDLSMLNRDLKQVLLITASPDAYALQPENAIKLDKWTTEKSDDTTLIDLLPFLEAIVRTSVTDVRDVVRSYDGQYIPTAFRERMAKVQEAKLRRQSSGKGFFSGR
jgi:import inner membrane translocase subunit TIM50